MGKAEVHSFCLKAIAGLRQPPLHPSAIHFSFLPISPLSSTFAGLAEQITLFFPGVSLKGKVYLVDTGRGDPDLLTREAPGVLWQTERAGKANVQAPAVRRRRQAMRHRAIVSRKSLACKNLESIAC